MGKKAFCCIRQKLGGNLYSMILFVLFWAKWDQMLTINDDKVLKILSATDQQKYTKEGYSQK